MRLFRLVPDRGCRESHYDAAHVMSCRSQSRWSGTRALGLSEHPLQRRPRFLRGWPQNISAHNLTDFL